MEQDEHAGESLPLRGAWIEIDKKERGHGNNKSLPLRGAWIEILLRPATVKSHMSLPLRGAWIEISSSRVINWLGSVAPLAGSVD